MEYSAVILRNGFLSGHLPWVGTDAGASNHRTEDRREKQEDIDFCIYHCPFPECVCDRCDGKGNLRHLREKTVDTEQVANLLSQNKKKTEIMRIMGISKRMVYKAIRQMEDKNNESSI